MEQKEKSPAEKFESFLWFIVGKHFEQKLGIRLTKIQLLKLFCNQLGIEIPEREKSESKTTEETPF